MTEAQRIVDRLLEYALAPGAQFRFQEFKWMANMGGYDYPVDVYWGETYLGVAEVKQAHVEIYGVKMHGFMQQFRKGGSNSFKTLQHAAEAMLKYYQANADNHKPLDPEAN